MSVDYDLIRDQVEHRLPTVESKPEEELYADVGRIALQYVSFAVSPSHGQMVRAGKEFVETDQGIHDVICNTDNKGLILGTIDAANVTSVIVLLAPVLGFPPAAVPAAVISLAVLVLKVGINAFCRGYTPPATGGRPS